MTDQEGWLQGELKYLLGLLGGDEHHDVQAWVLKVKDLVRRYDQAHNFTVSVAWEGDP